MRRLLLIFLLVFLPFQTIWAAASPYCGHEAAAEASHFGHHVHQHHAEAPADPAGHAASLGDGEPQDADALGATGLGAGADIDCHACHGAGSGMVLSQLARAMVVAAARPAQLAPPGWAHPPQPRPERPNWSAPA